MSECKVDYEEAADLPLNEDAFGEAITAAQDANAAGDDEQAQLRFAIQVYLLASKEAK